MVRVNFLPTDYQHRTGRKLHSALAVFALFFTVFLAGTLVYVHIWELRYYERQVELVREQIGVLRPYIERIEELQKATRELNRKLEQDVYCVKHIPHPENLLRELSHTVPASVWFGQLQVMSAEEMTITGFSSTYDGVVELERRLIDSENLQEPIVAEISSTLTDAGTPNVSFRMKASLRH